MAHLQIKNRIIRGVLEWLNKQFIRKSLLSIFTSEGFLQYHFGEKKKWPSNIVLMPNKIHPNILNYPMVSKGEPSCCKLRFAFVGYIRYQSVYQIAEIISRNFSHHEFHFYGEFLLESVKEEFMLLKDRRNIFFHGFFKNPDDLPSLYSNIDVVVSTYDVKSINEQYLEPNKLYESIFFRTPIIVSKGTYLAQRVIDLNCGWEVDTCCEENVIGLVHDIECNIRKIVEKIKLIPQAFAIDDPCVLEDKLMKIIG
jgi:glycosyltransferase involved in cell wall biosynthesis